MSSTRETEGAAKALSKIALEPCKRQELWDSIEQRIDMDTEQNGTAISVVAKKRNHLGWGQLGAAVAALVIVASGITYGIHHQGLFKPISSKGTAQTDASNVPSLPSSSSIQLIYILADNPAQTKWLTNDPTAIESSVSAWLKSSKLYTGKIETSNVNVGSYVGPAQLHVDGSSNKSIVIYPVSHVEQKNGQYVAVYQKNVVAYSTGKHTIYLNSPELYAWLKSDQWQTEFNVSGNPLFNTSLTLPNGQTVTTKPVSWKDLKINLLVTSLPPNQDYAAIVGNNAKIISHENVSTPAGPATFVYFQRTPPAAASGTGSALTNEFYVISYGQQYAYVIQATVTGDASTAKSELISLLQGWDVPSQAPTIPSPNAELTQWRYDSGTGQRISRALYGESFKAFYLPVFIAKNDAFVDVGSANNVVTVQFKDMILMETTKKISPSGKVTQTQTISLPNLLSKVTVYTMADKSLTLSIHEPIGTYIMLSSVSIPLSQLEAIIQNMSPLNG
ncbi:hypothetical protein [Alicyclobacillus mengziensis]|uniref:Uncharacterized protein n=1 Tax=Alicyclobacillus mengziensis TaxID=2931921 RepID=A0A9X7W0Z9_9BACL|nr:hypothetical protein [Alicyclobacillus mengziensis]QSO47348.1 hypothetical protein JZ786_23670 [Alicyclobacillus mengziensis]